MQAAKNFWSNWGEKTCETKNHSRRNLINRIRFCRRQHKAPKECVLTVHQDFAYAKVRTITPCTVNCLLPEDVGKSAVSRSRAPVHYSVLTLIDLLWVPINPSLRAKQTEQKIVGDRDKNCSPNADARSDAPYVEESFAIANPLQRTYFASFVKYFYWTGA
jgi:hypothetical protein